MSPVFRTPYLPGTFRSASGGPGHLGSRRSPEPVVLGGDYALTAPWLLAPAQEASGDALLMPAPDEDRLDVSVLESWAPPEGTALAILLSVADGTTDLPD